MHASTYTVLYVLQLQQYIVKGVLTLYLVNRMASNEHSLPTLDTVEIIINDPPEQIKEEKLDDQTDIDASVHLY